MTGCPKFFDKVLLTVRAITSDKPPAGYGTISVTVDGGELAVAYAEPAVAAA